MWLMDDRDACMHGRTLFRHRSVGGLGSEPLTNPNPVLLLFEWEKRGTKRTSKIENGNRKCMNDPDQKSPRPTPSSQTVLSIRWLIRTTMVWMVWERGNKTPSTDNLQSHRKVQRRGTELHIAIPDHTRTALSITCGCPTGWFGPTSSVGSLGRHSFDQAKLESTSIYLTFITHRKGIES